MIILIATTKRYCRVKLLGRQLSTLKKTFDCMERQIWLLH